jgi:septal ring factor EnvC (AmiA/AmiB activator)
MSLTADQKKGLPADIIAEIEEDEKAIARLNSENADRRAKYNQAEKEKKAVETMLTSLRESMEKVGLRTDSDIEEQFPVLIEKITKDKGYKPSSEVDALTKQVAALTKKYEAAEAAAVAEKREAMLERVGGTFDPCFRKILVLPRPLLRTCCGQRDGSP